ncbi:MAG: M23 family metallopeptidase, partial [Deltaproteobacteria bacterium]|nr:M23 family metallopeptidase [Deltaproteobacteria bacterium]
ASLSENAGRVQQDLLIDFQKPKVEVLSLQHVASQGGAEFVVYRAQDSNLSESGVRVGEAFFRGYKAESMDPSFAQHPEIHVALFALPFGFDAVKQKLAVEASDSAGNSTSVPLHFRIATTVQPNVASKLTEKLLTNKVPALVESYQHMAGRTDRIPLDTIEQQVAAFKIVNEDFRALLEKKLQDLAQSSDRPQLWKGVFLKPMPSATSSTFGESRNYTLKDLNGGHSMHNGLDLASVANDKVVAANDGVVVLAGDFGIYGNAIVIDHGLGLFSLYGHLSSVSKNVGDSVEKGAEIGRTGQTGLAGGDHLHFEFRIRGTPVTPIEWWDAKWLQDNIDGKLAETQTQLGSGASAASK